MTVEEARAGAGRRVIYQPPGRGVAAQEMGTITEVRDVWREGYPPEEQGYVMVRYAGDTLSKATAPELLTFAEEAR
jgi:hypothetical protein